MKNNRKSLETNGCDLRWFKSKNPLFVTIDQSFNLASINAFLKYVGIIHRRCK